MEIAEKLYQSSGYEEISLCSLSTGDYTQIDTLIKQLTETYTPKGTSIALPSLRLDTIKNAEYMDELASFRKAGLTFAPEAGTQRLRDVINKGIYYDDLIGCLQKGICRGMGLRKALFYAWPAYRDHAGRGRNCTNGSCCQGYLSLKLPHVPALASL